MHAVSPGSGGAFGCIVSRSRPAAAAAAGATAARRTGDERREVRPAEPRVGGSHARQATIARACVRPACRIRPGGGGDGALV